MGLSNKSNDFMSIKILLNAQVNMYKFCGPIEREKATYNDAKSKEEMDAYLRTEEISEKHMDVVIKMRHYFDSLEVRV